MRNFECLLKACLLRTRKRKHDSKWEQKHVSASREVALPFSQEGETWATLADELPVVAHPARDENDRYAARAGRSLHSFL